MMIKKNIVVAINVKYIKSEMSKKKKKKKKKIGIYMPLSFNIQNLTILVLENLF